MFKSEMLTKTLFTISDTEVSLLSILIFLLIIFSSIVISMLLQRGFKKALSKKFEKREGTLAAAMRLFHYTMMLIGLGIGLQVVGINLSALFAAGAVFAIAIGFAMQNIIQNFVSGVILLLERSIKPGDILEVEGNLVKVIDMGIRTTVVRTRLQEDLIMPNSIISQSTVKNYTLRDNKFRLKVLVGVSYDSDMEKVMEVLHDAAMQMSWKIADDVRVLMLDFGTSSVDFGIYLTVDDPWEQRFYMSEVRRSIWAAFKKEGIVIAYPQLDVHLDSSFNEVIPKKPESED